MLVFLEHSGGGSEGRSHSLSAPRGRSGEPLTAGTPPGRIYPQGWQNAPLNVGSPAFLVSRRARRSQATYTYYWPGRGLGPRASEPLGLLGNPLRLGFEHGEDIFACVRPMLHVDRLDHRTLLLRILQARQGAGERIRPPYSPERRLIS